jgi:hypothetical protein
MKKLFSFFTLILLLLSPNVVSGSTYFRFEEETKTTEYIDKLRHQELIGTINYNGTESYQKINYLGGDPSKDGIAIVTADNYLNYSWGKGTLENLKDNIHTTYDNYEVIGGVNGDFFGANGIPIAAYIRDYNVISAGLGYDKSVLGFKDNGEVVFTKPDFDGYELVVYNEDDEIKTEIKIDNINELPIDENQVSVYFDNFEYSIDNGYDKIVLKATETHFDDWNHTFYGRGILDLETNQSVMVEDQRIVIVGNNLNHDELITSTDYVVIQKNLSGNWEDVRFAISGWEILVTGGKATEVFTEGAGPNYRHPRTAVGIKEDGTVFFITVDGRDDINGFKGITEYELSQVMLFYGAVDAFNLDGGGSSAMLLKNDDGVYNYVNTPSDGTPRSVTNGVFFVLGTHKERVHTVWPDERTALDAPSDLFISRNGLIDFSDIANATGYEITIDSEKFTVSDSEYQANLETGVYDIKIRAIGDADTYKNSLYTDSVLFNVYSEDMQSIINFFINYTQEEIKD